MKTEKAIFPKLSKVIRKRAQLNQQDVIDKLELNITINTLSNYENGYSDTPASLLLKLADFYGCSIDALLSRSYLKPLTIATNFSRSDFIYENGIGIIRPFANQESYAFDQGIDLNRNSYQYIVLNQDDPNIHLEKNTRLVVRMKDNNVIEIDRMQEQIYLIFDTYRDRSKKLVETYFFTKASMVKNDYGQPHQSNMIYYTQKDKIQFIGYNRFKSMIEGIVVKTFIEPLEKEDRVHTRQFSSFR